MNMGKSVIDFNEKKGFICDMDGVIYHGNQILPGVPEFIQWLHDEKKEYLFLTNNSGYTPRELNQKLARMGLDVPEEHFYTSALATAAFILALTSSKLHSRLTVLAANVLVLIIFAPALIYSL